MTTLSFETQNRIRGGAIALLVEVLIGYGLVLGFSVDVPVKVVEQLKLFNLAAEPPPPPLVKPKPKPTQSKKASGAASPKNIRSKATEIVAPEVPTVIPPPPMNASVIPFVGSEATTGATQQRGPGTGAGGYGTGTGSGGEGNGEGGDEIGPRWKSGKIRHGDFASIARDLRVSGTGSQSFDVSVIYTVQTNGRATNCTIERASGNPAFDRLTCRLIEERLRFKPALDEAGRPVARRMGEDHTLTIDYEEKTTREYR